MHKNVLARSIVVAAALVASFASAGNPPTGPTNCFVSEIHSCCFISGVDCILCNRAGYLWMCCPQWIFDSDAVVYVPSPSGSPWPTVQPVAELVSCRYMAVYCSTTVIGQCFWDGFPTETKCQSFLTPLTGACP